MRPLSLDLPPLSPSHALPSFLTHGRPFPLLPPPSRGPLRHCDLPLASPSCLMRWPLLTHTFPPPPSTAPPPPRRVCSRLRSSSGGSARTTTAPSPPSTWRQVAPAEDGMMMMMMMMMMMLLLVVWLWLWLWGGDDGDDEDGDDMGEEGGGVAV
eukprot:1196642-Rhodomonas_salina.3